MYTPQHQPSNALQCTGAKYTTDNSLVDDLQLRNNLLDIEYKKNTMEYIEVSDEQVSQLRQQCYNEITRGDAVAIILAKHFKEYEGLVNDNGDDHVENETLQDTLESTTVKRKKIVDSMYDHVNGVSLYFLK